ncbi:MAG: type II secretion system F family protein [Bdellovibrionota bacterium]
MPFYLELITLMIDSGVSVSMGIELICQHSNRDDLFIRSGKMVLRQKASGMSFEKAVELCIFPLKNNLLEDFYAFVVESERSGMPLKAALQSLSISMWDSLICKLETKAQKAPVKILFPLVAFIFPVVFILLFAPLAHQLMHVL